MGNWTNTRQARILGILASAWIATACAPLDDVGLLNGGCSGLNITADGGATTQLPLLTSAGANNLIAQPFIATTAATISSVSLNLQTVSSINSQLSGTVTVNFEADGTTLSTTPTQPSGTILSTGTLAMSSISINQPMYYSITLPSVNITLGSIYWVIVYASIGVSPTGYIGWDGSSGIVYSSSPAYSLTAAPPFTALTQNMDIQLGCQ
jgi:hypothetical protein